MVSGNFTFRASDSAGFCAESVRDSALSSFSLGIMVRIAGLEPARLAALPPQSSVSANSTISATRVHSTIGSRVCKRNLARDRCVRGRLCADTHDFSLNRLSKLASNWLPAPRLKWIFGRQTLEFLHAGKEFEQHRPPAAGTIRKRVRGFAAPEPGLRHRHLQPGPAEGTRLLRLP